MSLGESPVLGSLDNRAEVPSLILHLSQRSTVQGSTDWLDDKKTGAGNMVPPILRVLNPFPVLVSPGSKVSRVF